MIRLGKIGFVNCDFPYYAIEKGIVQLKNVEIIESHPVDLAKKIEAGELDISPISSIMYQQIDNLLVLPGINIASDDFTKSVLVCSNGIKSLEELRNKTLCLPDISASSAVLIQIILKIKGIHDVKIKNCVGRHTEDVLKQSDSALFIGDQALTAAHKCNVIADLGNEWRSLTGKKMVYAVWVVRKEIAESNPGEVAYIHSKLIESKNYSYQHIEEIAKTISAKKHFDRELMENYFHTLNYDLDDESIESLNFYFQYAKKYGFIKKTKKIALMKA